MLAANGENSEYVNIYDRKKSNKKRFELSMEPQKTYILDEGISSYELAALFTDEEITTFNEEIMEEAFNDEPLEDYLLENTDIEDLIE